MGLFRRTKNTNKPLIRQIIDLCPRWMLSRCSDEHQGDKGCSKYRSYDQFVAMTFGQLNKCFTLSDISTGIGVSETFIADLGLDQSPARSTMSDGNKKRSYKVFETLYYRLLTHYGRLLSKHGQSHIINEMKDHDSKGLAQSVFRKGTVIVEDRAYFDFSLMLQRIVAENVFVTRIKTNTVYETVEELELPEGSDQDILKDEVITLSSNKAVETGIAQHHLRLVHVYKQDENKVIEIITNNLDWSSRTIADLYKKRWDIELFFYAKYIVMQSGTGSHYRNRVFPWAALRYHFASVSYTHLRAHETDSYLVCR